MARQVLFELPSTLQKCLDRKAYGEAVEAYCPLASAAGSGGCLLNRADLGVAILSHKVPVDFVLFWPRSWVIPELSFISYY